MEFMVKTFDSATRTTVVVEASSVGTVADDLPCTTWKKREGLDVWDGYTDWVHTHTIYRKDW